MIYHLNINQHIEKNHCCETSLLKLVNDSLWAMEQQEATILVIMDLSAASDTVHHHILLSVLNRIFGFQGNILNWVKLIYVQETLKCGC